MMLIFMQDFEIAGGRDITGMVEKIWRVAQIQNLLDMQEKYKIPQEVIRTVEHIAEILDAEYGMERMKSVICRYGGMEWFEELYLITNDYGITVVYSK